MRIFSSLSPITSRCAAFAAFALCFGILFLGSPVLAAEGADRLSVGPAISDVTQIVYMTIYGLIGFAIQRTIRNKALKDLLMASLDKAADYGVRVVNNLTHDTSVSIGNERLSYALQYALTQFPALAKKNGFGKVDLARMLWARLPVSNGGEPDFAGLVARWEREGVIR
ncbi:hypothetical protein [Microvirga terricola]|uniref:Uncharacterized protein n=1 Tax=Microvirga terricola TaxID=2719797 RepID=A0ABX0VC43_9HYPH|nr:hypothetical protein [Microvirga terricola]NIX75402.1 hypothetical protein [Microvirga terricola]